MGGEYVVRVGVFQPWNGGPSNSERGVNAIRGTWRHLWHIFSLFLALFHHFFLSRFRPISPVFRDFDTIFQK